jgi:COMPASS component SWD1
VSCQLHPSRPSLALVCCAADASLVDFSSGAVTPLSLPPLPAEGDAEACPAAAPSCALFWGADGCELLLGGAGGALGRVRTADGAALSCARLSAAPALSGLLCSPDGRSLAALCGREPALLSLQLGAASGACVGRPFRDSVSGCAWLCAALSRDGATLAAGARGCEGHAVHLWSCEGGCARGVLEGPPEAGPACALAWHPRGALLASLGGHSGRVYLWARATAENWSAFAPDFKELERNEEYMCAGGLGPLPRVLVCAHAAHAERGRTSSRRRRHSSKSRRPRRSSRAGTSTC